MEERHLDSSFSSLMDQPVAPEGDNPFFREFPTVDLEMYDLYPQRDGMPVLAKKMAQRFIYFLSSLMMLVLKWSAGENDDGKAKFVEGTVTGEETDGEGKAFSSNYKIPMTPLSVFFGVLLKPMGQEGPSGDPIKFIFDFRDMYLAGFFYRNVFYHYEDARLESINVTPANRRFIKKMTKMNGGYMGDELNSVQIGLAGLWQSYDTLTNAIQRSRREVRIALLRIFVTVSETERFPGWSARMFKIFLKNLSVTVDHPEDDKGAIYSRHFNDWDNMNGHVALGQSLFKPPVSGYNGFAKLLSAISLVLSRGARAKITEAKEREIKKTKGRP